PKATIKNLANGTGYVFRVLAVNAAGDGAWSETSTAVTPKGTQTITFGKPDDVGFDQGSVVLNPTATSGLTVALASGSETVCTVSGSTVNFAKVGTCKITASQGGNDAWNAASDATREFEIKTGEALTPQFDPETRAKGGFSVQVSNHNADWKWQVSSDKGTPAINNNGLITVTGLTDGQSAKVTVTTKRDNYTDGSADTTGSALDVPKAPGTPSATTGDGQVDLSWTAPDSDGGSPVTGYKVQAKPATGGDWADTADTDGKTTDPKATIKNLANGTGYVFRVLAVNAAGDGAWSETSTAVTPKAPEVYIPPAPAPGPAVAPAPAPAPAAAPAPGKKPGKKPAKKPGKKPGKGKKKPAKKPGKGKKKPAKKPGKGKKKPGKGRR
ncbi:MAG: fibronectin type III domain-containing protein, partial [Candidatus Nanopelagicales bacterium]|nr:fibronectin type III domain-containing protein [Candidatus Nanopelagicales bacterium]